MGHGVYIIAEIGGTRRIRIRVPSAPQLEEPLYSHQNLTVSASVLKFVKAESVLQQGNVRSSPPFFAGLIITSAVVTIFHFGNLEMSDGRRSERRKGGSALKINKPGLP